MSYILIINFPAMLVTLSLYTWVCVPSWLTNMAGLSTARSFLNWLNSNQPVDKYKELTLITGS